MPFQPILVLAALLVLAAGAIGCGADDDRSDAVGLAEFEATCR